MLFPSPVRQVLPLELTHPLVVTRALRSNLVRRGDPNGPGTFCSVKRAQKGFEKMVSTRTTKQSKSPAKQPAKKASGKSHKRKAGVEDTNEESESEAESLSDEAIEARVQADLAKLEARKKAKAKPSKAEAELARLKERQVELEAEIADRAKVLGLKPKTPKAKSTGAAPPPPSPPVGGDVVDSSDSADDDDSDASSESLASIEEDTEGSKLPPSPLAKASVLESWRRQLKNISEVQQKPMRVLLRLVKACPIDESTAAGQSVLFGFVSELQTLSLTAQYGKSVAASVRALQAGSSAAGLVSPRILRQALAERRAIDEHLGGSPPSVRQGNGPASDHRGGRKTKMEKQKKWNQYEREGPQKGQKSPKGKGKGPCFTCGGPHMSMVCPSKFVKEKEEG